MSAATPRPCKCAHPRGYHTGPESTGPCRAHAVGLTSHPCDCKRYRPMPVRRVIPGAMGAMEDAGHRHLDPGARCGKTTGDEYTGPIGCNLPAGHDMVPADHPDYSRFCR